MAKNTTENAPKVGAACGKTEKSAKKDTKSESKSKVAKK